MQEFRKLGKNLLISFIILIIGLIVISLSSYINILSGKFLSIFKILLTFTVILVGSFNQGIQSSKRGFLEGLKIGTIFTLLFILLNFIFYKHFAAKNLLYYALIMLVSVCGGMLGISRRKEIEK
jgi:putative membrane protein (TIGR04086 family)